MAQGPWIIDHERSAMSHQPCLYSVFFGLSLSFGIGQFLQHFWGCLPDDLAVTIE